MTLRNPPRRGQEHITTKLAEFTVICSASAQDFKRRKEIPEIGDILSYDDSICRGQDIL